VLDHGRVFIEIPRLMSDEELADALSSAFAETVWARPAKPSVPTEERPSSKRPAFRKRKPRQ
jgi:hypothetical protein